MKKYCVIEEKIDPDCIRSYNKYYFYFRFFAIKKARRIAKRISKVFHNQDRVFIKKGDLYFNPDKKYVNGYGICWTCEPSYNKRM